MTSNLYKCKRGRERDKLNADESGDRKKKEKPDKVGWTRGIIESCHTKIGTRRENVDKDGMRNKRTKRGGCTWVRPEEDKEYKKRK